MIYRPDVDLTEEEHDDDAEVSMVSAAGQHAISEPPSAHVARITAMAT